MKCNYKPPKLTKEEQQDMANIKSTLPYVDRLQAQWRNSESVEFDGQYVVNESHEEDGITVIDDCRIMSMSITEENE